MSGRWPSTAKRLEAKLDKSAGPDGCWLWQGSTSAGYGQIMHNGKMTRTHRVAYEQEHGEIPEGMDVCHNCPDNQDNPLCCNSKHLWLGTHLENMQDRDNKGRREPPKGEKNGQAKLTEQDAIQIKLLLKQGMKQKHIAAIFDVSPPYISRIAHNLNWTHV